MSENEHIHELLPAYSLDALSALEAERVRQHLEGCDDCRAELHAYLRVTEMLPLAAPAAQAPSHLRAQVMTAIANEKQSTAPAPAAGNWWQRLLGGGQNLQPAYALAAGALILGLLASNLYLWQQLREERANRVSFTQAVNLEETGAATRGRVTLLVSEDPTQATLIAQDLPQLDPDLQYQFWYIKGETPISGGLLTLNAEGFALLQLQAGQSLNDFDAFGLSIEPLGGSESPTGDIVFYTEMDA